MRRGTSGWARETSRPARNDAGRRSSGRSRRGRRRRRVRRTAGACVRGSRVRAPPGRRRWRARRRGSALPRHRSRTRSRGRRGRRAWRAGEWWPPRLRGRCSRGTEGSRARSRSRSRRGGRARSEGSGGATDSCRVVWELRPARPGSCLHSGETRGTGRHPRAGPAGLDAGRFGVAQSGNATAPHDRACGRRGRGPGRLSRRPPSA